MQCPSCGFTNPEGAKFCIECGGAVKRSCPSCGFDNLPQAKFCADCGTVLGGEGHLPAAKGRKRQGTTSARKATRRAAASPAAQSRPTPPEAERRQLTVLFCDLVGSTALSAQLDPEELREVVRAYHETCAGAINRYAGHTAQHLGDGLLVYFGYPAAHEDDAQRAVRTGLEIVAALRQLNPRLPHPLQVRIGIHTGLVVIGEIGSGEKREILALGETPNLAARLQGLAEPDTVIISEATSRLVHGLFACQALEPQELKGFLTPLTVYRVLGTSDAQSRFEVAVTTGLTPLVGREHEMGLLRERWEKAKEGEGQAVLLSGEPGIGKSRLVQELKEQVAQEGATRIKFRCSPYYQNTALYPILEHLQRLLQFERVDTPSTKLDKLVKALSSYRFPQADTGPLLAALLSLPHPEGSSPLSLSPQKQKQKTHEALVAWIMEEAERQAVYCTWEDLHWADPTTLEILQLYLEQVPAARMLAVLTFRSEFQPPWSSRSYLSQITLSRLGRKHVEAMTENVTGGKILPAEVVQQIVSKTDGVPLFVEELTKIVMELGLVREANGRYELTGPLPPLAIPATLHDSLMARLDRLAPVKEIAQLGATLGREFSYEVIQAVSPLDEETLQQGLTRLVEAELFYQRGMPPQARYLFKHALVQETAYQSLLKSTRQQNHRQIAQVLEARFPETKETQPELLAHHYTEAGLVRQAIPYWQQAGQRATQRSAHVEAINYLTKGLELLMTLPDTPERVQQELMVQIDLGVPLTATKGYAASDVEQAYARARELCQRLGESPQLFLAMYGLWQFYTSRAELQPARELAEQLFTLAQHEQAPPQLLEAHHLFGITLFWMGEITLAWEHLRQGTTLYNIHEHRSHAFLYGGADPGVACLSYGALALWLLGYPDQALKRRHDAVTLARELSHPFSLVFAFGVAAAVHQLRREVQSAQEQAETAITLANEQGFPHWLAWGTVLRGWALTEQLRGEEGVAQIQQGLAIGLSTGTERGATYILALLTEAYGGAEHIEEGLNVLAGALAMGHKNQERHYEAELYRLKGELLLKQLGEHQHKTEVHKEAEAYFHQAIEIAQRQQAKSLELRAAMSLSRLWQQQGKQREAHRLLSSIYGWFTEGFDTKDLQEAKVLLEELN